MFDAKEDLGTLSTNTLLMMCFSTIPGLLPAAMLKLIRIFGLRGVATPRFHKLYNPSERSISLLLAEDCGMRGFEGEPSDLGSVRLSALFRSVLVAPNKLFTILEVASILDGVLSLCVV